MFAPKILAVMLLEPSKGIPQGVGYRHFDLEGIPNLNSREPSTWFVGHYEVLPPNDYHGGSEDQAKHAPCHLHVLQLEISASSISHMTNPSASVAALLHVPPLHHCPYPNQ